MKDMALEEQGEAFLDLSLVIEGKLIFTKQSPTERGGHENRAMQTRTCGPLPAICSDGRLLGTKRNPIPS